MITVAWCRTMASYNAAMNRGIYAAADTLADADRRAERRAFFGSLHGTLCHLLWADQMWMSRFAGWEKPAGRIADSKRHIEDWAELTTARCAADAGIEAWAGGLEPGWLDGELRWFSGAVQGDRVEPRWITVAHFFNHQTHHRGQAHCLLTQSGARTPTTDLPWVVDLEQLGLR